jgi:hypothetical protein
MIVKAVIRGVSALIAAVMLTGLAVTSAAAASPAPAKEPAARALTPTARVAPAPQFSKGFHFANHLSDVTLVLTSASGDNEGLPPIGSTMKVGQDQIFEVQYLAFRTGTVNASYDAYSTYWGHYLYRFSIRMTYNWDGAVNLFLTAVEPWWERVEIIRNIGPANFYITIG